VADGLLAGVRVADLAAEPAAMTGRILADLGAEVVKVEPPGGDPLRAVPPLGPDGTSLRFAAWNAGKTCVTVTGTDDPALGAILGGADARRQGIAVIHQHPAVFPDLSVAENVFIGRQPLRMSGVDWAAMTRDNAWDYPLGLVAPANFALHVNRYLHESPATKEHMAMVAVKNHFHAVKNPKAQLRYEITVEQALAAPMVVDPFGLYDCTPQSDGAAAVILAAEEVVDRFTDRPVWVRGVGLGMDRVMHQHKRDMTTFPPTVRAAKAAMTMAGLTPRDVDVAEVHDCFTGVELISYEDLGFVERFEAYKLVESREHYVGGSMPINPSGGLKAKGHPPGATGVAQCYELFNQLRGEAENQVDGARVALAHNIGGPTAVSAVTILSNEKN